MVTILSESGSLWGLDVSSECVIYVSGFGNTQNTFTRITESARKIRKRELKIEKVTIWSVVHTKSVLGPYYFNT